jgi:hypothetical protein
MHPTCIFVQYDSQTDINLSTKCPNQGLLIDNAVDTVLSEICQLRHQFPCSDRTNIAKENAKNHLFFSGTEEVMF